MVEPRVERQAERRQTRRSLRGSRRRPAEPRRRRYALDCRSLESASQAVMWRIPRKRPPPARMCASSTSRTRAPSRRSAWPTMPGADARRAVAAAGAHRRDAVDELRLADRREAPRGRRRGASSGTAGRPWRRCCGRCSGRRAARRADSASPARSHRWWCGSTIGRSGSRISSCHWRSHVITNWIVGALGNHSRGCHEMRVPRRHAFMANTSGWSAVKDLVSTTKSFQ